MRLQSVEMKPKINSLTGGFIAMFSTYALVASLLCKYVDWKWKDIMNLPYVLLMLNPLSKNVSRPAVKSNMKFLWVLAKETLKRLRTEGTIQM
jgi:hypothetical protein